MGQQQYEFRTTASVKECGLGFESGIEEGRGRGVKIFGRLRQEFATDGTESINWYTPRDDSPFASLNDAPPVFTIGAQMDFVARVEMHVWDRGDWRDVVLWTTTNFRGTAATKMMNQVRSRIEHT